jgi:RNA polymerase sigma-70 factor (ECF subfamily)
MFQPELETIKKSNSELFKNAALSYLNEIYGAAFRLSNDGALAEELTFKAYEKVCLKYFNQFKSAPELRVWLYRELLKSSFGEANTSLN